MSLEIVYKPTADLIPYVNNSRTHSDEQITQVASSIKEFGFTNPILIDEDGGVIAGHGRLMASKKLGLEEVPTITLKGLTEAQKKAYVIADNKLALNSSWDDEMLKVELEFLKEVDFDIDLLGFSVLPDFEDEVDYSILDDEELDDEVNDMAESVKRAIQIEFEQGDYEEALELIKGIRDTGAYLGGYILTALREAQK